MRKFLSSFCS